MAIKQLSLRQMKFCEEYVRTANATLAYKLAGYSVSNDRVAAINGARLLTNANVSQYLATIQKKEMEKHNVSKERVISELCSIAFGSMNEVVENVDGNLSIKKDAILQSIDSVSHSVSRSSEGYSKSFAFKRSDKAKALDMLCKLLGLYNESDSTQRRNLPSNSSRILDAIKRIEERRGKE